jgi:hypothetical protein
MRQRYLAATAVALLLAGCAEQPAPAISCGPGAMEWTASTLYFGLSRPGGTISPAAFDAFMESDIVSRFPDGMTRFEAEGRWRGASGEVQAEGSRVVLLLHPGDPGADARIEEIRESYKRRFEQESVLLTQAPECVSF